MSKKKKVQIDRKQSKTNSKEPANPSSFYPGVSNNTPSSPTQNIFMIAKPKIKVYPSQFFSPLSLKVYHFDQAMDKLNNNVSNNLMQRNL